MCRLIKSSFSVQDNAQPPCCCFLFCPSDFYHPHRCILRGLGEKSAHPLENQNWAIIREMRLVYNPIWSQAISFHRWDRYITTLLRLYRVKTQCCKSIIFKRNIEFGPMSAPWFDNLAFARWISKHNGLFRCARSRGSFFALLLLAFLRLEERAVW